MNIIQCFGLVKYKIHMKKSLLGLVSIATILTGCTSIVQKQTYGDYEDKLSSGQFDAATEMAIKKADINPETDSSEDLLWSLEAGTLLRMKSSYQQSTVFFDDAEDLMKAEDTENAAAKTADAAGSMLLNDTAADYEQSHYDGIMANSYKALNFMFEGIQLTPVLNGIGSMIASAVQLKTLPIKSPS